jgi:hypothetical protein
VSKSPLEFEIREKFPTFKSLYRSKDTKELSLRRSKQPLEGRKEGRKEGEIILDSTFPSNKNVAQ